MIIPQWVFGKKDFRNKPTNFDFVSFAKTSISKLTYFTNEKYKFNAVWNTAKVKSLFPLKDKVDHYSRVVCRKDCSFNQNYIGEAVRNAKIRWNEHEDENRKSEAVQHLKENPIHRFIWTII